MEEVRLYAPCKTGKDKIWCISVIEEDDKVYIFSRYGRVDGKLIEYKKEVKECKSKKSLVEQAIFEAKSKIKKKMEEGMKQEGNEEEVIVHPMLSHNYTKYKNKVIFPCFVQPKLGGVRAVFYKNKMYSRNGKEIFSADHILNSLKDCEYALDGELYTKDLPFEELVGLVKKQKITESDKEKFKCIKFIIFDVILIDKHFYERLPLIQGFNDVIKTFECSNEEEMLTFNEKFLEEGYEGTMIRNKLGFYEPKFRSYNLQKYKLFFDEEFKIIDFTEGSGYEEGCIIFICETKEGKKFKVRPEGTREKRKEDFLKGKDFIGSYLNVKFQEMTQEGVPRFPVGVYVRDSNF